MTRYEELADYAKLLHFVNSQINTRSKLEEVLDAIHDELGIGYEEKTMEEICEESEAVSIEPLGIMPRHIWEERRFQELKEAIDRRKFMPILSEWLEEYCELKNKILAR